MVFMKLCYESIEKLDLKFKKEGKESVEKDIIFLKEFFSLFLSDPKSPYFLKNLKDLSIIWHLTYYSEFHEILGKILS